MSHQNCLRFFKDVVYDLEYHGAVDNAMEGQRMSQAIGSCSTLLHRSHGTFVLGPSIAEVPSNAHLSLLQASASPVAMTVPGCHCNSPQHFAQSRDVKRIRWT